MLILAAILNVKKLYISRHWSYKIYLYIIYYMMIYFIQRKIK